MSIRSKIAVILFVAVTAHAIFIYAIQRSLILPSYCPLENQQAQQGSERHVAPIERETHLHGAAGAIRLQVYWTLVGGLGLIALIFVLVQRTVVRPISQLTHHAVSIGQEEIASTRPAIRSGGEVGTLAREFQRMVDRLADRERSLRASEEQLRGLIENLAIGLARISPRSDRFIMVNPAAVRMFGYDSAEELAEVPVTDLFADPSDRKFLPTKLASDGKITAYEVPLNKRDGSVWWGAMSARAVRDSSGQIEYFDGVVEDITERKRMEESLRLTQFSVDVAADAFFWVRPDASFSYVNDAACRLLRHSREELLKMSVCEINPAHPREAWPACWEELRQKKSLTFEAALRTKEGYTVPVEITANYVEFRGEAYNCSFVRDITDRKQAEESLRAKTDALEQEQRNLQAIFDAVQVAMLLIDEETAIASVNEVGARLVGKRPSELLGRQPGDALCCIHAAEVPEGCGHSPFCPQCPIRNAFERVLRTGESLRGIEVQHGTAIAGQQGVIWLELNADPITIQGLRYVLLSIANITDRKRAEESLRESNAMMCDALKREKQMAAQLEAAIEQLEAASREARAATQAKSEFLANMSHEIRTPLTAILGYADVLLEEGDISRAPPLRIEALKTIRRNGEHLLGIINDILDISKIEAGRLEVERIPCSPPQVIADVLSLMRVRAAAGNLALNCEYVGPIPETFQTDPLRLRQILVNLIGNAIKFTEEGGVRIITRLGAGDTPTIQFDVLDTGIGMSPAETARLFQPFTQADSSTARRFGGTGLGLTISRRLAQMLGGDIAIVQTEPGAGTQLRVTVPTGPLDGIRMLEDPMSLTLEIMGEKPKTAEHTEGLRGRILLAEDGPDNQRLIAHVLKKAGAEVTTVENGQLAVDAAMKARDAGTPFDVILMDMQMPVMDGYQATRLLRQEGYAGPIIALTAHAMASDRQKCIEAGCDDHAVKPIDRRELIETLRARCAKAPADLVHLRDRVRELADLCAQAGRGIEPPPTTGPAGNRKAGSPHHTALGK